MNDKIVQDRGGAFSVKADAGQALAIKNDVGGSAASQVLRENPGKRTVELTGKEAGFVRRQEAAFITAIRPGERRINVFPPEEETIEDRQGQELIRCDVSPPKQRASPTDPPGVVENFPQGGDLHRVLLKTPGL